jgi:REP element-mobilizing transposase RayT
MYREPERGHKDLRKGRCSLAGQIYLVTTVTRCRRPVFRNWDAARCVARTLDDADLWHPHSCLCWVLMPDHWHGLVRLGERAPLSAARRVAMG